MTGEIPQSSALEEAETHSLSTLMDKLQQNPEGFTRLDRDKIIEELRAQRARFAEAERLGKPKRSGLPKATSVEGSTEELGL
jgi:hypothetical protein